MRRLLPGLVLGLVLLAGCFTPLGTAPPAEATRSLQTEGPAVIGTTVSFTLPEYPGRAPHDFLQDRGHVVLLDVWATWCEPCREALPLYQDLLKQYAPRGLRVYALSVDEDPRQIAPFLKDARVTLPVLLDPNGNIAEKRLQVSMMPTLFVLDKKGVVRKVHQGFTEGGVGQYQNEIEALLNEPVK